MFDLGCGFQSNLSSGTRSECFPQVRHLLVKFGQNRCADAHTFLLDETVADDCFCLLLNRAKMIFARKAFGVDFVDVLRTGRSRRKPSSRRRTFKTPIGAPLPGAVVIIASIGSPASSFASIASGESLRQNRFLVRVCGSIDPFIHRSAKLFRQVAVELPGSLPSTAVISAASKPRMRPSLSVVQTCAVLSQE